MRLIKTAIRECRCWARCDWMSIATCLNKSDADKLEKHLSRSRTCLSYGIFSTSIKTLSFVTLSRASRGKTLHAWKSIPFSSVLLELSFCLHSTRKRHSSQMRHDTIITCYYSIFSFTIFVAKSSRLAGLLAQGEAFAPTLFALRTAASARTPSHV